MNNDLISRKALRDELCKYRKQFLIGSCENIIVSAAIGFVNSAPTAFNKEKVIEELEIASKLYRISEKDCEFAIPQNIAFELIEKGGIE